MKPRVLVIAEAANPEWVSVPLVGWSLANALREVANVHLVTQVRNRDAILRAGWIEGVDFTAIDSEAIAKPLWAVGKVLRMGEGKGWTMLQAINALSYPTFERRIWKLFGARLTAKEFDIVHRVTPLSPTITSGLAAKCARIGVPFVLGPLNGGVPWPAEFATARRQEREWLSYLRGAYKLMPGRIRMLTHTAAILAGSRHTQSEIPAAFQSKTIYLPENAIDLTRFNRVAIPAPGPLRACFIGRMVPYKGPDMLLAAAAPLLREGRLVLDMIGDGPMMPDLLEQVKTDRTNGAVTFHGWKAHADVQNIAAQSSVFAFPSIREFGGGVVLEAMALGLVPLIVDYAGPGELVTADIGRKVPLGDRTAIMAGFRAELERMAADPAQLIPLAETARARVQAAYTWPRKAAQVAQIYDWVLRHRVEKPDFSAELAGKSQTSVAPDV
jgi:glycosyltransferase involved in cell wall biosynthesis